VVVRSEPGGNALLDDVCEAAPDAAVTVDGEGAAIVVPSPADGTTVDEATTIPALAERLRASRPAMADLAREVLNRTGRWINGSSR
jgi:hypothetical protein